MTAEETLNEEIDWFILVTGRVPTHFKCSTRSAVSLLVMRARPFGHLLYEIHYYCDYGDLGWVKDNSIPFKSYRVGDEDVQITSTR